MPNFPEDPRPIIALGGHLIDGDDENEKRRHANDDYGKGCLVLFLAVLVILAVIFVASYIQVGGRLWNGYDFLESRGHRWIRQGSKWVTRCPLHPEGHPSFTWYPARDDFHCYSCGYNGDIVKLIGRWDLGFHAGNWSKEQWREAYTRAREVGIDTDKKPAPLPRTRPARRETTPEERAVLTTSYAVFKRLLQQYFEPQAYLRRRGLRNLSALPLGWCPGDGLTLLTLKRSLSEIVGDRWWDVAHRVGILYSGHLLRDRIYMAEVRDGQVRYQQWRRLNEEQPRYVNPPDYIAKHCFDLESLDRPNDHVFLVEGRFDSLPLVELGASAVAFGGSDFPEFSAVVARLGNKIPVVATDWDGVLAVDENGEPDVDNSTKGQAAAIKLMKLLELSGKTPVRLPQPPNCKDLGDLAKQGRTNGLLTSLQHSLPSTTRV